jgi:hypothetical protein
MASGYTSRNVLLNGTAQAVAASATEQVVSEVFLISADDADAFRADLVVTGHSGTVDAVLEFTHSNDGPWISGKEVSVTGNGTAAIIYNPNVAGDQEYMPLPPLCRISITTAAASGATIEAVWVATRR